MHVFGAEKKRQKTREGNAFFSSEARARRGGEAGGESLVLIQKGEDGDVRDARLELN